MPYDTHRSRQLSEAFAEGDVCERQVKLARDKIATVGKKCIGDLLLKLQVYKALGDVETGGAMYNGYSEVNEEMAAMRAVRRTSWRCLLSDSARNLLLSPSACGHRMRTKLTLSI